MKDVVSAIRAADLGNVKVESLTRSERTAKWNRLLEIEGGRAAATLAHPLAGTR